MANYFHSLFEEISSLFSPLSNRKAFLIISFLGLLVFFNCIFNNFVGDDESQIINNPIVHSIGNIPLIFTGSTFYNGNGQKQIGSYYKPILSSAYSIIYTLFGPNSVAFHMFPIVLHVASSCVLFLFFKCFFKKSLALILSLVFLVHPINSEAVFYVSAFQEPLFFLFGIFAIYLETKFSNLKQLFLISLFLFLSLLSKETGVLFTLISVIYGFLFNRKRFYKLLVVSLVPLLLYIVLRAHMVGLLNSTTGIQMNDMPFASRLINIPQIFWFYLKTFFYPIKLASSYTWTVKSISFWNFVLPGFFDILFIFLVLALAFFVRNKRHGNFKLFLFFLFWFFIGIGFHIQIFPLDATVSERWFYFPIVGLLGMIGVLLDSFNIKLTNKWVFTFIFLIISLFSIRTFVRSFDWRSEQTLTAHDIKVSPDSYPLESQISVILLRQGRFEEAKLHAEHSIAIYPNYVNTYNLAGIYFDLGEFQKAKEAYISSLHFADFYGTYEGLGQLTLVTGNTDENIKFLKAALDKYPNDPKLWLYLAILEYQQNDSQSAKTAINNAYLLNQDPETTGIYKTITNNLPLKFNIQYH